MSPRPLSLVQLLSLGLATLTSSSTASAARITHAPLGDTGNLKGVELILIQGQLASGDEEQFRKLSIVYDKAIVELDSPGGSLLPAIEIGKMIHLKEYYTLVAHDETCTSACALIWMGGSKRNLSPNGKLGFHASYSDTDGRKEETGVGNALVGHYLGLLGLPEKAIIFATVAPPDQIQWLTSATKSESGIDFNVFNDAPAPPPLVRMQASSPPRNTSMSQGGWVLIGVSDTTKHYMKANEIFSVGAYQAAWSLVDHRADPDVKYNSSKDLWYYDCTSRRQAIKSWVDYDARGNVLDSHENQDYSLEWASVVPGSIGESKFDVVCKR